MKPSDGLEPSTPSLPSGTGTGGGTDPICDLTRRAALIEDGDMFFPAQADEYMQTRVVR